MKVETLGYKVKQCVELHLDNMQSAGSISKQQLFSMLPNDYSIELNEDKSLLKVVIVTLRTNLHVLYYDNDDIEDRTFTPTQFLSFYNLCCTQFKFNGHAICYDELKAELSISQGDISSITKNHFCGDSGLNYACKHDLFSNLQVELPLFLYKKIIHYCMLFDIATFEKFMTSVRGDIENKVNWWEYPQNCDVVYVGCEKFNTDSYKIKLGETQRFPKRTKEHFSAGEFTKNTLLNQYKSLIPRKDAEKNIQIFIEALPSRVKNRSEVYLLSESDKNLLSKFLSEQPYLIPILPW